MGSMASGRTPRQEDRAVGPSRISGSICRWQIARDEACDIQIASSDQIVRGMAHEIERLEAQHGQCCVSRHQIDPMRVNAFRREFHAGRPDLNSVESGFILRRPSAAVARAQDRIRHSHVECARSATLGQRSKELKRNFVSAAAFCVRLTGSPFLLIMSKVQGRRSTVKLSRNLDRLVGGFTGPIETREA